MAQVFLSYARGDAKRIQPLVEAIEHAGLSVFWDREIPPGRTWRDHIGAALREAQCVLVAWSKDSIESNWVVEEAEKGQRRKILVPFLLDAVDPPLGFGSIQAADLTSWDGAADSALLRPLLNRVRELVATKTPKEGASLEPFHDKPVTGRTSPATTVIDLPRRTLTFRRRTLSMEPSSYRWLWITLLIGASLYTWNGVSKYSRLNALNQRRLSNAAAELRIALENAAETVRQFNEKWNTFDEKQKPLGRSFTSERPQVCDFIRSQPYLDHPDCDAPNRSSDIEWSRSMEVEWGIVSTLGIVARNDISSVFLGYRTDSLLQELAFPDSFELIFVATDSGVVLYRDTPGRRRWFGDQASRERDFRDAYADRTRTVQIQNVREIVGGEAEWVKLRSVDSRTRVELGGTAHQLYLQPLVLNQRQSINLVIGAAVPLSSLANDALALGTPVRGLLVFVFLVGVLGFPVVKLACLDEHERFSLWDIKRLCVSSAGIRPESCGNWFVA